MNMQNDPIITLHRHFIWANKMRTMFDGYLKQDLKKKAINRKAWEIETNMYMALWYGLLYVLVEGWEKKLQLRDKVIDKLLKNPNKDLLRRYRNACFHFEQEYNNKEFEGFKDR